MRARAIARLTLPDDYGHDPEGFWDTYFSYVGTKDEAPSDWRDFETRIYKRFGDALVSSVTGDFGDELVRGRLSISVDSIRYGSIELLLTVIGGEELIKEAFWRVLEFYAPTAFNVATGAGARTAPLRADVVPLLSKEREAETEKPGTLQRLLVASQIPLVAWFLLLLGVIYFGYLYLEKIEKENERLSRDYNSVIIKVLEQNMATTSTLIAKATALPATNSAAPPAPPSATSLPSAAVGGLQESPRKP